MKQRWTRQKHSGSSITMLSWKKVYELVFRHSKQLVQRTEPAEPLITVIYKPDSTLMGRQNLPSLSFLCSASLPLSIPDWLLTYVHLFLTSSLPDPHFLTFLPSFSFPLLLPLSRFQRPSYLLPWLSHCFAVLQEKWEGRDVNWAGEFPHKQRKNVFLVSCITSQYSLRSGLGPRSSLGMAWDKAANNNSPLD